MTMRIQGKAQRFFISGATMLVALAVLLCSAPVIAGAVEEGPCKVFVIQAPRIFVGKADAEEVGCKGLKPFNDIDDLLYQIYTNLDSECLFKMEPTKLAEIWRIPSVSYRGSNEPSVYLSDLIRKSNQIHGPKAIYDYLVLEVTETDGDPDIDYFIIKPDYDVMLVTLGTPSNATFRLPKPLICSNFQHIVFPNPKQSRVVFLSGTYRALRQITVRNSTFPGGLENCHYQSESEENDHVTINQSYY